MRIVKFIGLKIIEIAGALGILYVCSFYFDLVYPILSSRTAEMALQDHWLMRGFIGLLFVTLTLAVPMIIGIGLYFLVKKNWKWANRNYKSFLNPKYCKHGKLKNDYCLPCGRIHNK